MSDDSETTQPGAATRVARAVPTDPSERMPPSRASAPEEPAPPEPTAAPTPEAPAPAEVGSTGPRIGPMTALQVAVVLACMAGVAYHQSQFWGWYIEDAAISFAYARNWAWGEGLVAYPGGERLEGYSNFTWVVLLAIGELLGFDGFQSSKAMQMVLGMLTVPLTFLLAREAAPSEDDHSPLAAAAYLAAASTFAIWGACGLENGLFNFLLAAALLRSAIEIRTGGFPWAALLWCLLAMTRPEAILYAAIAGFLSMCFTVRAFGPMPTVKWLVAFFVPFATYHAIRFWYFAFEFPQTYYGKMTNKEPKIGWNTRGWRYVRNWSHDLWTGYFLPLWFFGLLGTRGWRGGVALLMLAVTGFWLMYPTNDALDTVPWWPQDLPAPAWWVDSRSFVLVFDAMLLPLLALGGRRGWRVRMLVWGVACAVLFFSIYTLGDWMKAWRWMNLLQVPAAVLFGLGAGALADVADRGLTALGEVTRPHLDKVFWALLQVAVVAVCLAVGNEFVLGRWALLGICETALLVAAAGGMLSAREGDGRTWGGWTVLALVAATAVLPNVTHTEAVKPFPETGPFAIKKRVEFVQGLKDILEIEGRLVDLDVDMGAHMWWGRDDFAMMDMAGLVDIPLAQHRFQRAFVKEYVFEERRPHFAHVHGGWASNSRIPTHPEWRSDYYEIPGYPAGRSQMHIGNHIRRDLVMQKSWKGPSDRRVRFDGGVALEGFDLPSEPARGRMMWIEIAVRDTVRRLEGQDISLLLFAHRDGQLVHTWDVPLAYGWFHAQDWRPEEVNAGKYKLPIPADMEEGLYDLGFAFVDPDGRVLPALDPATAELPADAPPALPEGAWIGGTEGHPAVFANGEVSFPGVLKVVTLDELSELAKTDRMAAIDHARHGRCEQAEHAWFLSRKHRPVDKAYLSQHAPAVETELAICWSWRADHDAPNAVRFLERARLHDHLAPAYLKAREPVADRLYAEGKAALDEGRWEEAFRTLSDCLRVDPSRSWARRYAEQARAYRLGIDPESLAEEEAKREEQRVEAIERRKKAGIDVRGDEKGKAPPKAKVPPKAKAKAEPKPEP